MKRRNVSDFGTPVAALIGKKMTRRTAAFLNDLSRPYQPASAEESDRGSNTDPPKLGIKNRGNQHGHGQKFSDPKDPSRPYQPKKKTPLAFSPAVSKHGSSTVSRTSSYHSEPTFDRRAKPKFMSRTHYDIRDFIDVGEQPPRGVSKVVLMLAIGQGGEFSSFII